MSPSQLAQLASEIAGSQSPDRPVHLSEIKINTKNTCESYDSIEELRKHKVWEKEVIDIAIIFSENCDTKWSQRKRISISSGASPSYVSVSGDDIGWVEGTMDTVVRRMKKHYVWYNLFVGNIFKSFVTGTLAYTAGGALGYFVMSEFIITAFGLEITMESPDRYIVTGPALFFGFLSFIATFFISDKSRIVADDAAPKMFSLRNAAAMAACITLLVTLVNMCSSSE